MGKSQTGRILILCKTYPSPSAKYAETSCVAGMSEAGRLIRLYPVPFRLVADEHAHGVPGGLLPKSMDARRYGGPAQMLADWLDPALLAHDAGHA